MLHRKDKKKIAAVCTFAVACAVLPELTYAATDEDKAANIIRDLNTILSAAKQYTVDTGEVLPVTADTDPAYGYLKIDSLITDPGIPNWNGPYLPYKDYWLGGAQYINHPVYNAAQLLSKEDGEWALGSEPNGCKQSSESCSIAACIWLVPDRVAKQVNYKIDEIDNKESSDRIGKIRYDNSLFGSLICMVGDEYPKEMSPVQ